MNRPSLRMILFILVLSALHMAAMAPSTLSSLPRLQPHTLTSHGPSPPNHLAAEGLDPHVLSRN
jgi:hypothetical protein